MIRENSFGLLSIGLLSIFLFSCARAPLKHESDAMRKTGAPALSDDMSLPALLEAVNREIDFLSSAKSGNSKKKSDFIFGPRALTSAEMLAALKKFSSLLQEALVPPATPEKLKAFYKSVSEQFDFYEVYGTDGKEGAWGEVFMTSYYEPVLKGSSQRTERYTQALYAKPPGLLSLDLSEFGPFFSPSPTPEKKLRLRVQDGKAHPFFNREEIDSRGSLAGQGLELCWVDPVEAFMLQVQGSGVVDIDDGVYGPHRQLRVGYAEKNGWKYEALGKVLIGKVPNAQITLQTLETYLHGLTPSELQKTLNANPSYVFFKPTEQDAVTSLGVTATDGRTIATDSRYFPKGAIAFLSFPAPEFADSKSSVPSQWIPTSRFVLDQDIGGAITGGGRLDLFWGRGDDAKRYAGVMKQHGKLYYLVPKR